MESKPVEQGDSLVRIHANSKTRLPKEVQEYLMRHSYNYPLSYQSRGYVVYRIPTWRLKEAEAMMKGFGKEQR